MESHNSTPLYSTQGSPAPRRAIIAGSYPIRAPPSIDSDFSNEKEIQDNGSNSSGSSISSDESEGFVSGEDGFETASEKPSVADPDDDNLEFGGEIDEGVAIFRNSGNSDVGFERGVVSMPIAQLSGVDDEVGEDVLSESDDAFSGVVRVRVSGIRAEEEGFEDMGETPELRVLGSENFELEREDYVGGIVEEEKSVDNGFSGVVRVPVGVVGGEEAFGYADSRRGGEDVLNQSLNIEENGIPKSGENPLLDNKASELIESNVGGVEEENGVRGNEEDENSRLGTNPVDGKDETGGDSVAAKSSVEDVLPENLKTDESGDLKLGESPLSEIQDLESIESNVGDAEDKNGIFCGENDQNPHLGMDPVNQHEMGRDTVVGSMESTSIGSANGAVEIEKTGLEVSEDLKDVEEEVLPESLEIDKGDGELGESPVVETRDAELIETNVGVEEVSGVETQYSELTKSNVSSAEVGNKGDDELGESPVVETWDAELIETNVGAEEVSGVETQDSELTKSNIGSAEVGNRILNSECDQDPKLGVEPDDQPNEPKMDSVVKILESDSTEPETGVAGVDKIRVSSNGSDVTHVHGTETVLEIQDAKFVKPEADIAVDKTEVLDCGCDLKLESGADVDADEKLDSKFSKADSSIGEKEKDAVGDSNSDKKVEAITASEQEYSESKTGTADVEKDEALGSIAVDSVIHRSMDKLDTINNDDRKLIDTTDKQLQLESESSLPDLEVKANDPILGLAAKVDNANSSSSRNYLQQIDGQIILDSDEEMETDEEGDEKELFDSAALAALLEAASGAPTDGTITISSPETAARIFSGERPAGLGSSIPSLKPAPRPNRPNIFSPSDLASLGESDNNMSEEEKKMQEKIQTIRVKFLRLVQRLGHSPEDTVAAQVLYRLGLAEGIRRGRQASQAFNLDNARKTAFQLEMSGTDDLDFACNILVLGKTGVGKSATINSIFGEEKTPTNAFRPTTSKVREIIGFVDGVKIRVIDTPGLRPSVMDQTANRRILSSINKFTKKCPPDIVLYVDRLDTQSRDFNDLPMLRSITGTLGSSIWFNAIVALTHAASAPPDGANGSPLSYEVSVAQRSHIVQHSIRQAAGDMRLMNPVALVENHPSCRRNREGHRVLPNGQSWRSQLLLLCYSSKILSEANSLLKLQEPSAGKLFGLRFRSPPLPFLLSSLLQSRSHPKLPTDQGLDNGDSDIDLADLSDSDQEEEDEYDQLPPFKPLRKVQIAKLSKEQRKAYFDEYNYRVKLLQKKQWREELKRMKEIKKRAGEGKGLAGYGDPDEEFDQENGNPAAVPVPMPDMILPPTFDGDNPVYRYRFLEPTSQLLARPVLDTHGWDHDCGYDGVNLEESLAIAGRFPAGISVQITKDKKEFNVHLDSSVSAKYGESGSTLAGFDIQTVGKQLAYILRTETKFKNLKKNKTVGGLTVTFLGETVATGLKLEDQITIGRRVCLVASTGAVRAQGDTAYGANLEARLREKDFPIGQDQSTLGLSLMRWRGDLAVGANLQSQFSVGQNSKMAVRVGLNNKLSGQITVRISSSEQLQMALVGILPIAVSVFRSIWTGESYFAR